MIDDGEDRSWEAFERYVWEAVKAGKIGAMRLWAELTRRTVRPRMIRLPSSRRSDERTRSVS